MHVDIYVECETSGNLFDSRNVLWLPTKCLAFLLYSTVVIDTHKASQNYSLFLVDVGTSFVLFENLHFGSHLLRDIYKPLLAYCALFD